MMGRMIMMIFTSDRSRDPYNPLTDDGVEMEHCRAGLGKRRAIAWHAVGIFLFSIHQLLRGLTVGYILLLDMGMAARKGETMATKKVSRNVVRCLQTIQYF